MNRPMTLLLAGAALVGLGAAKPAFAGAIIYNYYTETSSTVNSTGPANSVAAPISVSFGVPTFDTTLGTLNAITVTFSTTETTNAKINATAGDQYSGVIASFRFAVSSSATGAPTTLKAFTNYADTPGQAAGTTDGSGPGFSGTLTSSGLQVVGSNTQSFSSAASIAQPNFAAYETAGNGSVNFAISTGGVSASGASPDGSATFGGSASASGQVTVEYDYSIPDPVGVPEPASMAILGAGLLGAGLLRRRSRK